MRKFVNNYANSKHNSKQNIYKFGRSGFDVIQDTKMVFLQKCKKKYNRKQINCIEFDF